LISPSSLKSESRFPDFRAVAEVRVDPLDRKCPDQKSFDACYRVLFEDVRRLIARPREWDSNGGVDFRVAPALSP